jgi:hypothetical protein
MQQRPIDRSGVLAPQGFVPRWIPLTGSQGRQLDLQNRSRKLQDSTNYPPAGVPEPPQQWQQGHQPASLRTPWPVRHKAWTAVLFVIGVVVVLGIATAIFGNLETTGPAGGQTQGGSATSGAPSPTAGPTGGQVKFVSAIRASLAAKGLRSSSTDAKLVSAGARVCTARHGAATQATLVSMWASAPRKFAMSARKFVGTAEKYLCPQYVPRPPVVILTLRGSGMETSRSILVTQPALRVKYSYDCSSFGGPGNFIADFTTANENSLNSDSQSIASALSTGGAATVTIYPRNAGSEYHLAVNSQCDWSITVSTSGS